MKSKTKSDMDSPHANSMVWVMIMCSSNLERNFEIGIIKELYKQGLLSKTQMDKAIRLLKIYSVQVDKGADKK